MLWKAGYGHCRSRWHYASRVIISLGGRGDNRVQVCDGLAPAQSCTPLFLYKCGSLAARANGAEGVRESVAGLPGHSLTAKGGNRGCWSGCLGGGFAGDQTDRRASTFFLMGAGISTAAGSRHHRPNLSAQPLYRLYRLYRHRYT